MNAYTRTAVIELTAYAAGRGVSVIGWTLADWCKELEGWWLAYRVSQLWCQGA